MPTGHVTSQLIIDDFSSIIHGSLTMFTSKVIPRLNLLRRAACKYERVSLSLFNFVMLFQAVFSVHLMLLKLAHVFLYDKVHFKPMEKL